MSLSDKRPFRQSAFPPAPAAPRRDQRLEAHGDVRDDPYAWLRDPGYPEVKDPEILGYLTAENDYAEAVLGGPGDLRDLLFDELKARLKPDDEGVPFRQGDFLYQVRFQAGQEYPVFLRRAAAGGDMAVILDVNRLAEGKPFCRVADIEPSPDGRYLAFTEDSDGSERYAVQVKDLETGLLLADRIEGAATGLAWAADSRTLFYTLQDEHQRPKRVLRHRLGAAAAEDVLVYDEPDPGWFVGAGGALSGRFVIVGGHTNNASEVRLVATDAPDTPPRLIAARRAKHEYMVADQGDRLWILTDDKHINFRLVSAPLDDPREENWTEVVPGSDRQYFTGLLAFRRWLVLFGRRDGGQFVSVRGADGTVHEIAFPDATFSVGPGDNHVYDSDVLRLRYQSLVTPPTVFDYHLGERRLEVLKVQEIPGGYDAGAYATERLLAPARDGTPIPISLVYRKDFKRDGRGLLHLYGYGAYGHGLDPSFSTSRLSLLDRGFAYAIAHVRGGDEMGRAWYEAGKLERKLNSFTDFLDCAQHLVGAGWTGPGGLSIEGGSAGGLLVGAVLNMVPDGLVGAAVAQVPFVDVVSTMLDDTLPLTVIEYEEWGNPNDPAVYHRLKSYSPYDNVTARAYPHLLITAGLSDPRVTYWEPAKWAARLRALKTDDNVLLLRTEMDAGHAGSPGRFDRLKEVARAYAFLLTAQGAA